LVVTLAGTVLTQLGGTNPANGIIVTDLPAVFADTPGDYLLVVSTGTGQSQNDEYDLTIGSVSGGDCPAGQVVQSIDANGQVTCVKDMHVKDTACPAGQVVTGYDANGVIQCALDQNTDTNVFNTSCPAGQVVTGYDVNGVVQCKVDLDTNVFNTSCPEGAFLTGYAANGDPQCTETGPPPPGDCPCSGITFVGLTWGDDFETSQCGFGTGGGTVLVFGGFDEDLRVVRRGGEFVCLMRDTEIPGIEPLSDSEIIACGNELVAIADADGVTCGGA